MTERDVERLFFSSIREELKGELSKRKEEIHVIDIASDCFRKVYFEKKMTLLEDIPSVLMLWEGVALHENSRLLSNHEMQIEYKGVKGKIDEYDEERGIIIDKKFVTFIPSSQRDLVKYYQHYVRQLAYYAVMLVGNGYPFERAFLLFVKRGYKKGEEKSEVPLRCFDVTEFINLEEAKREFEERLEELKEILSKDVPPQIPEDFRIFQYPCSYCKYQTICWLEIK
ncbi:MAG: PD-(D/E)XK nuclease family protein [Candidatus Methanospirareceae archaeon]